MNDFIFTLDSDSDSAPAPSTKSVAKGKGKAKDVVNGKGQKRKKGKQDDEDEYGAAAGGEMTGSFVFDSLAGYAPAGVGRRKRNAWEPEDPIKAFKKPNAPPRVDINEIIDRHKADKGSDDEEMDDDDWKGFETSESEAEEDEEVEEDGGEGLEEEDEEGSEAEGSASADEEEPVAKGEAPVGEEDAEAAAAKAYFDQSAMPFDTASAEELAKDSHDQPFSSLPGSATLSRPILLGLSSMALTTPTPIQRQTIPMALLGKDLVCSSVTGSGKTVGYLVPVLERLHWRDRRGGAKTRVLVLTPTRELAVQVHQVARSLARFTDLTFSLCVGGMNLRTQEAELRDRPDVVIGTPGRVIDHVRNTRGFTLDALEILVIDEADRILEEGFHDELEEIVGHCPRQRQTMLFSATVSEKVADLARLSLDKPVRIKIDPPRATAAGLTQEFLRVRDTKRGDDHSLREATLVTVCRKVFKRGQTIVFFRSKKGAHRMKVVFSLAGLKAEELHGDLTQEQRLTALQRFKDGEAGFLLATDLASRGLDIRGVENVVNYEAPVSYDVYLHRIGRTARAGRSGRALTLAGEADRKLVKEARRNAPEGTIRQRKVPGATVSAVLKELAALKGEVEAVLEEEQEEKAIRRGEMEVRKGRNLVVHDEEIKSRPARTWFQSERDKKASKKAGLSHHNASFSGADAPAFASPPKRDRLSGLSRSQKRRKLANEEDAKDPKLRGEVAAGVRAAKRGMRKGKVGSANDLGTSVGGGGKKKFKGGKGKGGGGKDKGGGGGGKGKSSASMGLGAKAMKGKGKKGKGR